jgi:hypothetical protein
VAQKRDYKAEYQRRLERAAARGLSRSQARGHARAGETPIRSKPVRSDDRLEAALKALHATGSQGAAAKAANVSPERFRRFLRENGLAKRQGRKWDFSGDRIPRRMTVFTSGKSLELLLDGFDQASLNGAHQSAVRAFINSNDIDLLRGFEGKFVRDTAGRFHPLETDPNRLHRIAAADDQVFHEIYRLII